MIDTTHPPAEGTRGHLSYDVAEARRKFGKTSFTFSHDLVSNPLFELERLAELADRLPAESVENYGGNTDVLVPDNDTRQQGPASAAEAVRTMAERPGWVTLPTTIPGLPRQSGYQELFEEILHELVPMVDGGLPTISDHHAVIIVASGGNTTPAHVDPEPSFLLHIRGSKRFSIGRHPDPAAEQRNLERFYTHQGHNTPEVPVDLMHFDLNPGEGLHVPPVQPHWVVNGPEVVISFSVGFQTAVDHRRRSVYQWNSRVRKLGLTPKPYGESELRDRVKGRALGTAFEARRRLLRRPA